MSDLISFITNGNTEFTMENIVAFFCFCIILEFLGNLITSFTKGVR